MTEETGVDRLLDLKGEVCPYTFIKSKLALEEMDPGQILEVIVDNEESAENVPGSLTNEGQKVLAVEKLNPTDWKITVRKESGE